MGSTGREWSEWLADPGRTGTSSPEVVARAVELASGEEPAVVERLRHGEVNEVYDVGTTGGQRLAVRIGRRTPSLFPAERWALDQARAAGATVPEVLLVDEFDAQDERLAVCVERHTGGVPLQQLAMEGGLTAELEPVVREAGRNLALVHQVVTDGFGALDSSGRGPDDGWADFLALPARQPEWYRPAAIAAGVEAATVDRALVVLEAHADVYEGGPRLVHADFGAKHVLADRGFRALIDFELCRGGDPAYDVAAWDIYFHNSLRTDWLLDGYREVSALTEGFDLRVRLCLVLLAMRLLAHSAEGFTGFVPLATRTIERELAELG